MTATSVTYNPQKGCFWWSDFTGKERDPETGYSYFGARYLDHTPLTLWLSVDPMADKYPSISPYAYCAGNPLKLVDLNGMETICDDDIVIKGINNSSITIKTDAIDITLYYNTDFGGNHVITAPSNMAIGYEVGRTFTGSAKIGSTTNVYKQSMMLLDGPYSRYWYDYYGAESQINYETSLEASVGIQKNWFIAYCMDKSFYNPKGFAGKYIGGQAGCSIAYEGLGVSLTSSVYESTSNAWIAFSVGTTSSVGIQSGLSFFGGGHAGGEVMINQNVIKTSERSRFDIFFNWFIHATDYYIQNKIYR